MPHPSFPPPDTMPLREALRGLRFLLRHGGETFADIVSTESLPKPASQIAGAVLREVTGLARSVDDLASGVVKTMLGAPDAPSPALQDLIHRQRSDVEFGAAFYVALTTVLRRLGAPTVFVSEAAARSAFAEQAANRSEMPTDLWAADLTLRLLAARVLRGTTAQQAALVPGAALEAASVFAVLLWLQSTRSEDENEAALDAATDMAAALASEISQAVAGQDAGRIADLYRKYAPHV